HPWPLPGGELDKCAPTLTPLLRRGWGWVHGPDLRPYFWRFPTHERLASGLNELGRLFRARSLVHDGHQRAGHAGRVGVRDDVAAINNAGSALLDQLFGAFQNFFVG